MLLPVCLKTTVRTKHGTAASVPDALNALKSSALLSTSGTIRRAGMIAGVPVNARHSYSRETLQQATFPLLLNLQKQNPARSTWVESQSNQVRQPSWLGKG